MEKTSKRAAKALLIINIAVLALFGVLYGIIKSLERGYSPDNARRIWDSDIYKYSQISLYTDRSNGFDALAVYSLRRDIKSKLKDSSVKEEDTEGRLWVDCASGEAELIVNNGTKSCDAAVMSTYGDFFLFHPEPLLSGSYYTEDDINIDTIVIDKQCSWLLFGAIDTAGMNVTINGKTFRISAVVDTSDKERDKTAYGQKPRIYMHYETLRSFDQSAVMTNYEICIPNVVRDYAYGVMKEINPAPESRSAVIDQTGRFDIITLFKGFGKIPESVMVTADIRYPWFENRVRGAEIIARLLAGPAVMMLLIPALSAVYALFIAVKLIGKAFKAVKGKADEAYQKKISEEYRKKHRA